MKTVLVSIAALAAIGCSSSARSSLELPASPLVVDGGASPQMAIAVPHFNGLGQSIQHGTYWKEAWPLVTGPNHTWGPNDGMYWEMIFRCDGACSGAQYVGCDGAYGTTGGIHRFIFSGMSGNVSAIDASGNLQQFAFGADDPLPPSAWNQAALMNIQDAYGNHWEVVAQNGVWVGQTINPGGAQPWVQSGGGAGSGLLEFGTCTDHSGFVGQIYGARGWDLTVPGGLGVQWRVNYVPQRWLTTDNGDGMQPATFNASYAGFGQTLEFPDVSSGYDGNGAYPRQLHPGSLGRGQAGAPSGPPPQVSLAVNAPFAPDYVATPACRRATPAVLNCPAGAKICDNFDRSYVVAGTTMYGCDQDYYHLDSIDLGVTQGGSLGPKRWSCATTSGATVGLQSLAGIYNGSLVVYGPYAVACTVQSDSTEQAAQITRRTATQFSPGDIGLAIRMVDATHGYLCNYQHDYGSGGSMLDSEIYCWRDDGGALTFMGAAFVDPANASMWSQSLFGVTAHGSTFAVYWGSTQVMTFTDSTYAGLGVGEWWAGQPPPALQRGYDVVVM